MPKYRTSSNKVSITSEDDVLSIIDDYVVPLDVFVRRGSMRLSGTGKFKVFDADDSGLRSGTATNVAPEFLNRIRPYLESGEKLRVTVQGDESPFEIRYIVTEDGVFSREPLSDKVKIAP